MDIIVDIDGTLADTTHRQHLVSTKPKNWKAYFLAMGRDAPIHQTITVVNTLHRSGHNIILVSGRPSDYIGLTFDWLKKHQVSTDELYMRSAGDMRPDDVVKRELLEAIRADGYDPELAIDDRDRVVAMWRREGIPCWQVAPGDF